ncbi:MAG: FtsX-like permease family protein, partial [Cyclobacteriaceae bacterium]
GYLLLLMLTSLAAGSYPSWVLSGFNPIQALSGREKLTGRHTFAKSLVVVQFALSSLLIIGTITIYSQIDYLLTRDLGYDDENLIRISLSGGDEQAEVLKNELSRNSNIVNASAKSEGFSYRGIRVDEKEFRGYDFKVDEHYLATLGISLKEGRNFSSQFPADSSQSVIINETFAREAGWGEHAIGQTLSFMGSDTRYTVIGVVNDYHFRPLKVKIEPVMLHTLPKTRYGDLLVKVNPDHLAQTMAFLEVTYRQVEPLHPFKYEFVDLLNAREYQVEQRWKQIMSSGAVLAVLISCIGLFALAALSIQQRTKEVGIRKVLGASINSIVALLSGSFFKLALIAFIITVPLGFYGSDQWLENFAYRIEMSWWMFACAGALILLISFLIISFQSVRAARSNPVDSLKSE